MTIVEHVVHVHSTIGEYTLEFQLKLRRKNYVTPKHYLDFIHTYLKLLDEKNNYIIAQVGAIFLVASIINSNLQDVLVYIVGQY